MKSFSGIGTGKTSEAIKQATAGLNEPQLIIFFSGIEVIEEASELLVEAYPGANVMGVAGSSYNNGKILDSANFSGKGNKDIIQVLALFDDADISCGVLDRLDSIPLYKLKEFSDNLKMVNPGQENTVCIGFPTDYEENFVSTVKTILEPKNIPLVGGTVSGHYGRNINSFILLNGEKYEHAAGYIFIKNKVGKIKTYRNDTYVKQNRELMQITKIGGGDTQRTIVEIDGERADKVLAEKFGVRKEDIEKNKYDITSSTPISVVIGEKTYVSSLKKVNSDGSVELFKKVYQGGALALMKMGDCAGMESDLVERMKKDMKNISFVFSVDCIYRFLLYNSNGFLETYLKGLASVGNHVGFVSLGEQDRIQHFNQTMVCAVFE